MDLAPPHAEERERLAVLAPLLAPGALDEARLGCYTRVARSLAGTPVASVSLTGADRQLFRGSAGEWMRETPRPVSLCAHALLEPQYLYVPDATRDERFADNPTVVDEPHIRFYAGFPVWLGGHAIGTLCLIDFHPRVLASDQLARMRDLADCVQRELQLQRVLLRSG